MQADKLSPRDLAVFVDTLLVESTDGKSFMWCEEIVRYLYGQTKIMFSEKEVKEEMKRSYFKPKAPYEKSGALYNAYWVMRNQQK